MKIVVLDDMQLALDNARAAVSRLRETGFPLLWEASLSEPVTPTNHQQRLKDLEATEGEAIFFIDLGFGIHEAKGKEQLLQDLRSSYNIPRELIPDKDVDGVSCGVAIVRNQKVKHSLVVVNTGGGKHAEAVDLLRELINTQGRTDEIQVEVSAEARTFRKDLDTAEKIIRHALERYGDFMTRVRSGPFALYLREAEAFGGSALNGAHDAAHDPLLADRLLGTLLDLSPEEVTRQLRQKLPSDSEADVLAQTLCTMGINVPSRPFAASGAWLVALGAYRHVNGGRNWHDLFRIEELKDKRLRDYYLLPQQELPVLRESIRLYYEMCRALFRPHGGSATGPLRKVSLNSQTGLLFDLAFPCVVAGGGSSVFRNVAECRRLTLAQQELDEHDTSTAIWRYWLASSTAVGTTRNALFGKRVWRLNVTPTAGGGTEVTFFS